MKVRIVREARKWILGTVLLAGLVFSAVTLISMPAYARCLDCAEAYQAAYAFCTSPLGGHRGLNTFICPYNTNEWYFACNDGYYAVGQLQC